MMDMDICVCWK